MLHAGCSTLLAITSSASARIGRLGPDLWAVGHRDGEDWWSFAGGRVAILPPAHRGGSARAGGVLLGAQATLPPAGHQALAVPQGPYN